MICKHAENTWKEFTSIEVLSCWLYQLLGMSCQAQVAEQRQAVWVRSVNVNHFETVGLFR